MTSPLPDSRVPMDVLLDEKDEEFLAEWDAEDAEALAALQLLLDRTGQRPLPRADLQRATARLREVIAKPGWPGQLLVECSGLRPADLPADDTALWLGLAAGVACPRGSDSWDEPGGDDDEPHEVDSAIAAICAIDHFDWLAVITALAEGGPGTSAAATDLAAYVRDYDPDDGETDAGDDEDDGPAFDGPQLAEVDLDDDDLDDDDLDDDGEFDEIGMEDLFLPVTALWQALGAIDDAERLTAVGWWGLPEAMRLVWAPAEGSVS